jgi:hypothetical protein
MLEKIINDSLDIIISQMNSDKYNDKIKIQLIDPLILYIVDRFYPYLIITGIIFVLIFIILLCIFFITLRHLNI